MKNFYIFLLLFLFITTVQAQWSNIGQIIYGEEESAYSGSSVSINAAGNRIALYDNFVNGDSRGRVRVFELQVNTWTQLGEGIIGLLGDGQSLGIVKLDGSGNRFVFSSPIHNANGLETSGIVRIFEFQGSNWIQIGNDLTGESEGDYFGVSIDISDDGNIVVVGANQSGVSSFPSGYVKAFIYQNNNWELLGLRIAETANSDRTGTSVSISKNGNRIAVGSPSSSVNGFDSGLVRIFELQNNNWTQIGNTILGQEADDELGDSNFSSSSLSLNLDGNIIATGSPGHKINGIDFGQVRVFELQNNNWVQLGSDINGEAENGTYGITLSLNSLGNILAVGNPFANGTGEVQVFKKENNTWQQFDETIIGSSVNEWIGWCVDVNAVGDNIIIGSPFSSESLPKAGKIEIIQNSNILSISRKNVQNNISIYPNPSDGNFSINFQKNFGNVLVNINNITGKNVYEGKHSSLEPIKLNRRLSIGLYFVNITTNANKVTYKLIVQ